jgi:hypothetical protein
MDWLKWQNGYYIGSLRESNQWFSAFSFYDYFSEKHTQRTS